MPGVFSCGRALSVGRKIRTRMSRSEAGIILFSIVCNFRAAMFTLWIPEVFLLRVIYRQKAEGSEEKSPDAYSGDAMRSMAEGLLLPAFRSERCALGRLPEKADDALPRTLITQDFMQNRVPSPTEGLCENGFREVSLRELVCGATMPPLRKSNCLKEGSLSKRRLAAERAQCLRGSLHVLGVPVFVAANIPCGVSAGWA